MGSTENNAGDTRGTCCGTSIWHSSRVQGATTLVLILLAAFLFAQTINSLKAYKYVGGDIHPSSVINVSGTGEEFVRPDTAEFTFTVYEEADTAGEVQDMVAEKADTIVTALKDRGVEERDIRVRTYALNIKYENTPATCPTWERCDQERVRSGYSLRQVVEVKARDLSGASELIALATDNGASEVGSLQFTIGEPETHQANARAQAIEDAQEKAGELANDLGVTLVRVVGFNENMPYQTSARMYSMDTAEGLGGGDGRAPVLPSGENHIVSNVHIQYEIR